MLILYKNYMKLLFHFIYVCKSNFRALINNDFFMYNYNEHSNYFETYSGISSS